MDFTAAAAAAAAGLSRSHHWRTEQKSEADRRTNTELPPHKIWFKPNKAWCVCYRNIVHIDGNPLPIKYPVVVYIKPLPQQTELLYQL